MTNSKSTLVSGHGISGRDQPVVGGPTGRRFGSTVACLQVGRSIHDPDLSAVDLCPPTPGPISEVNVAIDYHALTSLSATLDDVVRRIGELARTAGDDDDAAVDLQEVERQLTTASRRLTKVVRRQR